LSDEIKISPAAAAQLSSLIRDEEDVEGIRIYVSGEGCSGMSYAMTFVEKPHPYDCVLEMDGINGTREVQRAYSDFDVHFVHSIQLCLSVFGWFIHRRLS